jgi:hypothetical protein
VSGVAGLLGQLQAPAALLVAGALLVGLGLWIAARLYWPTPLRYRRRETVPAVDALSELRDARWGVLGPVLETADHQLELWIRSPNPRLAPAERRTAGRLRARLRRLERKASRRASTWQPRQDFWRTPAASLIHLNGEANALLGQVDRFLRQAGKAA